MGEAFAWCLYFQRIPAVTARIETSFHQPIPIGTRPHIRAWITGQRRKLFDARAEVRIDNANGPPAAESTAVLYPVPRQQSADRRIQWRLHEQHSSGS
ncbi:PaaI family thioesterase [Tunturiibacter gelidiferens]|uniref:PaaI family thioesterase n=1 Tax=Tunturiibacter gelidiferens TaxID=3069689 RepID=UPI003D9B735A